MTSPNPQDPPQSTSTLSPSNKPEITLYWLNDYRAQRVVWLLEDLDLTYTVRPFHRTPSGLAPRELEKVYPLGTSPILTISLPHREPHLLHYAEGSFALTLVVGVILADSLWQQQNPLLPPPHHRVCRRQDLQGVCRAPLRRSTSPFWTECSPLRLLLLAMRKARGISAGGFLTAVDILLSFNLATARDGVGKVMVSAGDGKAGKIPLWDTSIRGWASIWRGCIGKGGI
ncbi:Putative protein of unknown function [Podospora comata]|uniref:GST N-terminal domain-containing protein n=1 Tax=Podospora comata TaxID=48703 RepID=A0ABY6SMJ4_PODCO|nr:Putative protein of unknown function [Podospora comata]